MLHARTHTRTRTILTHSLSHTLYCAVAPHRRVAHSLSAARSTSVRCHGRITCACVNVAVAVGRLNNAGMEPVKPVESLLQGVCQQALGFCADKDGDGVIELGEGCLIVSGRERPFCQSGGMAGLLMAWHHTPVG